MDLLDAVLMSSGAKEYTEKFRECNIQPSFLPLLTEDDLQIIGIQESNIRENILHQANTLQIPKEKKIPLDVNKDYIKQVLSNIDKTILLHLANLSCALTRKNIIVCDVELSHAANILEQNVNFLSQRIQEIEQKSPKRAKKSKKTNKKIIGGLLLTSIISTIVVFRLCINKIY